MKKAPLIYRVAWSLYKAGLITGAELDLIWANIDRDAASLAVKS